MNYKQLLEKLKPDPHFFTFDTFADSTQIEVLYALFTAPAFVELFARLDRLTRGEGFPLSITVRWFMAMAVIRENESTMFRKRLQCDTGLATLVLGPGQTLPECSWVSSTLRDHKENLLVALRIFYRELIRLFIRANPDVRHGYIIDAKPIDGYSNPPHRKMRKDLETGRLVPTDEIVPATDPDAWYMVKQEHRASRRPKPGTETKGESKGKGKGDEKGRSSGSRYNWGYQLSVICFIKKRLFPIFDLHAAKKEDATGELPVGRRMMSQLFDDYPELELGPDEYGVFVADSAYDDQKVFRLARDKRLVPIIPVRDDSTKELKGSRIVESHEVELRFRTDYTPLCAQGPLNVLPSELGKYPAQIFCCPMKRPNECETPCALEVFVDQNGYRQYPQVKFRVGSLSDPAELRQHPLFPRRGEQHRELFRFRSLIEGVFSHLQNYRYGCEGDARLKIRRLTNMTFRLYIVAITLAALAMIDDGMELDASAATHWGLPGLSFRRAA